MLLAFLEDPYCTDPIPIYKQLCTRNNKLRHNSSQIEHTEVEENEDEEEEENVRPGRRTTRRRSAQEVTGATATTSTAATTHTGRFNLRNRHSNLDDTQRYLNVSLHNTTESLLWRKVCKRLISDILKHPDSSPFRQPVDLEMYPDYRTVVERPMDFGTIKTNITYNFYTEIDQFDADCKLVFQNSKTYNTAKRSQVSLIQINCRMFFFSL